MLANLIRDRVGSRGLDSDDWVDVEISREPFAILFNSEESCPKYRIGECR